MTTIDIPDNMWKDATVDCDGSRLLHAITVNGVPHNAVAYEVQFDDDLDAQVCVDVRWQFDLDHIIEAIGSEGQTLAPVSINGREYLVVVVPTP